MLSNHNYMKGCTNKRPRKALLDEVNTTDASSVNEIEMVIDEEEIAEVLAQWTGIPVHRLTQEETARLLEMEVELHKRIGKMRQYLLFLRPLEGLDLD